MFNYHLHVRIVTKMEILPKYFQNRKKSKKIPRKENNGNNQKEERVPPTNTFPRTQEGNGLGPKGPPSPNKLATKLKEFSSSKNKDLVGNKFDTI